MTHEIINLSKNVNQIKNYYKNVGDEFWFLLSSDRHVDSPHQVSSLEIKHLKQAKERNAGIIDCGDLFDSMQGRSDPRHSKGDVLPELNEATYYDSVIDYAEERYKDYAENFLILGHGNHETKILKHEETDLTARLIKRLIHSGSKVQHGYFAGFVVFSFIWQGVNSEGNRFNYILYYHHGAGGGSAPVTKGVITANRMATYLPDPTIVMSGHNHEQWLVKYPRLRLNKNYNIYKDIQYHVKLPSYKDEFGDGSGGWMVEKGTAPKPLGAWWLRFYTETINQKLKVNFEILEAK